MSVKIESSSDGETDGKTLLDALDEARIFSVVKTDDGRFVFEESCDRYFNATLSQDQLLVLSDELRALAVGA